jgi:hypothetical protein
MALVQNPTTFAIEDVPDYISEVATVASDIAVAASTTLVNAPTLVIPYGPGQRFFIRYGLYFTTNATADFKFRLALPAAASQYRVRRLSIAPDALTTLVTAYDTANNGTTDLTVVAASGTEGYAGGEGIFVAATSGAGSTGVLQFQFAQNTSDAGATTLRAGSFLEYKQV